MNVHSEALKPKFWHQTHCLFSAMFRSSWLEMIGFMLSLLLGIGVALLLLWDAVVGTLLLFKAIPAEQFSLILPLSFIGRMAVLGLAFCFVAYSPARHREEPLSGDELLAPLEWRRFIWRMGVLTVILTGILSWATNSVVWDSLFWVASLLAGATLVLMLGYEQSAQDHSLSMEIDRKVRVLLKTRKVT